MYAKKNNTYLEEFKIVHPLVQFASFAAELIIIIINMAGKDFANSIVSLNFSINTEHSMHYRLDLSFTLHSFNI